MDCEQDKTSGCDKIQLSNYQIGLIIVTFERK